MLHYSGSTDLLDHSPNLSNLAYFPICFFLEPAVDPPSVKQDLPWPPENLKPFLRVLKTRQRIPAGLKDLSYGGSLAYAT